MPISFVTRRRLQVIVRCKDDVEGVEVEFEEGEALATKCGAQGMAKVFHRGFAPFAPFSGPQKRLEQ